MTHVAFNSSQLNTNKISSLLRDGQFVLDCGLECSNMQLLRTLNVPPSNHLPNSISLK
jgi:hypothetical protein